MSALQHDQDDKYVAERVTSPSWDSNNLKQGNLHFIAGQGANGGLPTYQEASGAPIESDSPLGYKVRWFTIIFLNIGQMVGTGVFSTRECFTRRSCCRGL